MDINDAVLTCAVNMQWTNSVGITGRKLAYKTATLRLVRNDLRELFVEVTPEKLKPLKFKLKDLMVHKKFMSEGKATFNFKAENCTIYLSNAPPGTLMFFLRTIFIKMNGTEGGSQPDDASLQKKLREHLLSGKPSSFEDVSPVTTAEMILARKKAGLLSKGSVTTPSPQGAKKRRFDELKEERDKSSMPAAKKLYQTATDESLRLSEEQMEVLRACTSGKNVFFTGSAGTGKSFLLRRIISALPPDGTVATASTGVAACLIGGTTLHAFAGIGGGDATMQRCLELASRPVSAQTWRKCKRLIIDEISMVDGQFFEKIEAVARHIRRNDRPFGGIQLILCGDFLQLPPVIKSDVGAGPTATPQQRFCFQSSAWETCIQCVFELKQVHRQSDPEFVKILNHLRIGHVNDSITNRLTATSKQKIEGNGILATQLCSHTNDANSINESKLENLQGDKVLFKSEDSDAGMTKTLDQQVQAPSQLYLKINAQVMLLKNINIANGLVNGARGVVVRMDKDLPVVRFKNNQEYVCKHEKWIIKTATGSLVTRRQVPLKLAWAFSIHKSQGLTLDCVEMSLSKVFEAGQAYVALSRAKSLQSIRILDFDAKQVWANPQVLQFYKGFRRKLIDTTMIPLGPKNKDKKPGDGKAGNSALAKLKKSLMNKPLVSIS
ncbi:LOW QUALITY PROTEIN: ATP-dependent DNA helicase PIF1 [Drosophila eugracilis]|uniref:LOW QUALITY PROTEIN: ATP-dependent DNA helicase PIF1 n=1 Tax=Drosophila eugracilis TaxID=29029 RepID=UPI001BDAD421|nr:LOW QUALITY PROTEIN: ATP-dependent DNA helicase PIF1 [Drosophila eugracilis]